VSIFLTILYLIFSIGLLYKGSEWLVGASARVAQNLRVTKVLIGMTVIAVGTSLPELMTSLIAAVQGSSDMALGNILGSNMANLGLVLALAVIIKPIKTHIEDIKRDAPWLVLGSVLLLILALDGNLNRADGAVLFLFAVIFFLTIIAKVRYDRQIAEKELPFQEFKIKARDNLKNYILMLMGLVALIIGAKLLITGALDIADFFNIPELFVGLTIVAIGTSLPELAASAWSAVHGKAEVTLGNVIGSNIANIFLVLGVVAIIAPISISSRALTGDIPIMIIFTFLAILLFRTKETITRFEGVLLLIVYIAYIIWAII
jgi:cation:H+ antiporter